MESRIPGDGYVRFGGGFSETCYSNIIRRRVPILRFKGKFIYWGIGSLIGGLALGGLVGALTNLFLGGFATLALMGAGLAYTFMKQGNGLHDKTRHRGAFIHPVHLSISYENREKDSL